MSISALLQVTAQATEKGTFVNGSAGPSLQELISEGLLATQFDQLYYAIRSVPSSGSPDTLDLNGGSLITFDRKVLALVKVVLLLIHSLSTDDTHILTVGGGTNSPAWLPSQQMGGKKSMLLKYDPSLAGYTVTAGTGDIVKVAVAAGTNVPYGILIAGRSA